MYHAIYLRIRSRKHWTLQSIDASQERANAIARNLQQRAREHGYPETVAAIDVREGDFWTRGRWEDWPESRPPSELKPIKES